ncbi:hypothetical protein [Candidatus Electronema sp. JC]|uniref:hypothetical protein n=1 Tax=Candidatus Electronema sp. JC TaxID=3401570 RepID=UPI003B42D278
MTRNQRRKTLDLAAAALALALLLPHPAAAAPLAAPPKAAVKPKPGPCANPSRCIAVDFDKAPLSEVVYLVSEMTGEGFVFDDGAKTPAVSWSQQNVPKSELLPTFIKVLTSLGLTVHRIEGSNFWAIRSEPALISGADRFSSGVYHLRHLDAEAVQKSAEALYVRGQGQQGDRLLRRP